MLWSVPIVDLFKKLGYSRYFQNIFKHLFKSDFYTFSLLYFFKSPQICIQQIIKTFIKLIFLLYTLQNRLFKEYYDYHHARDAISEMDSTKVDGRRIVVEKAGAPTKKRKSGPQEDDKCFECGRSGHW